MVKVLILGSTGMLGNAVARHFQHLRLQNPDYEVYMTHRGDIRLQDNSYYFDATNPSFANLPEVDYILNCIGIIKPFMKENIEKSIYINSIFPRKLSNYYKNTKTKVIHITTDCVYSGMDGGYKETDLHDCTDDYGKSKSLGEPIEDCMVLRTSIIGKEIHKNASLISWAISQKNKTVKGFTNHFWNGVTTKEYARVCQNIIENDLYSTGLRHIYSNSVNKYELLKLISDSFELNLNIEPYETEIKCDRTLNTEYELCKVLKIKNLKEQLEDIDE